MSIGLLLVRLALGAALLLQGIAKLRTPGRRDTAAYFEQMGIAPGVPFALLAGITELGAGSMLILGLGSVLAAAGAVAVLGIAVAVTSSNGYWNARGGSEYPLVAGGTALALLFTGAGRFSLDELLGWSEPSTVTSAAGIALAVAGAAPVLVMRARNLRKSPTDNRAVVSVGQVA